MQTARKNRFIAFSTTARLVPRFENFVIREAERRSTLLVHGGRGRFTTKILPGRDRGAAKKAEQTIAHTLASRTLCVNKYDGFTTCFPISWMSQ